MTIFSSLRGFSQINPLIPLLAAQFSRKITQNVIQKRLMSGGHDRTMFITPSRFQWHKFKDLLHFYVMLGLIPILGIVFYTNVFIGPATLTEIPEGYEPKHWEYYRHPITRFLARVSTPPQQEYEKYLHHIYEENEKRQVRAVEAKVKELMRERSDYQAYYYRNVIAKYTRVAKKTSKDLEEVYGNN
ncbi:NADH dehydrogenase [ubiquinone] 1 beta subcomplex subunit 5, mitochondrial [Lutzomyia longipalpis]|uniref:NADH dehydrogenase [ubiquinone] 1 beta subcomplex subunit 5, mitochondrial n=1 Tax=Lutzomyia longipalpis TaxID=7200 RepID=UPI00248372A8|nr:NADH dehydrogenase [ubiquinone] 1 beta subcomplex subunit 5, mitochondrial [Lutzomyia longipalpis]XP_055690301.1 NADH dehydrogenase [ubiquinone] 1 beta subcomplex subunit 5, mitochondrial [Lutzomyia longipalpis]